MPIVILRLLPENPISGEDFSDYLDDLTIEVHELSLDDPNGEGPVLGSASYIAPALPPSPSGDPAPVPDDNTRITQHFTVVPSGPMLERHLFSVATAMIDFTAPAPGHEHETVDIRLVIARGGSQIVHRRRYYNVPVSNAALPGDPNDYAGEGPTSLHLQLPGPGGAVGPTVSVPEDGAAPDFQQLRDAIEDVLLDEPGNLAGIADLTLQEARHIAREITWDRGAFPLPGSGRSLEAMFTGPHDPSSDAERDRRLFEGDLITYYVGHDGEADRLTGFVFALSAAIWCAEKTAQADVTGFVFPVFPGRPDKLATVHLTRPGGGPLTPDFAVSPEYFYALTAVLPPQVARAQRYDIAVLQSAPQLIAALDQAIDDNVFTEPANLNRHQAARRLWSLGLALEPNVARCPLQPGSDAQNLVASWLDVITPSTDAFWLALTPAQIAGHLELALCAITYAHAPLMAAIIAPPFSVTDIFDLADRTNQDWEQLFAVDPALLPDFTAPGSVQERSDTFIHNLRRFFNVSMRVDPPTQAAPQVLPELERSPRNAIDDLLGLMPGFDFTNWNAANLAIALDLIFPGDAAAQEQFTQWLRCIRGALSLTEGITPDAMRFSVTEAIWARGILNADDLDGVSLDDLRDALRGTVAFEHAQTIWSNAAANGGTVATPPGTFTPVNPDGSLTNCIAPKHLSPLGPVAYLKELLRVSVTATCEDPIPDDQVATLADFVAMRRGPLGDLLASSANLCTPIPMIDIVNETLENLVANGGNTGVVHDTARDVLGNHALDTAVAPEEGAHDAATLFCALPEHSTPATPTAESGAWDVLRQDFTACNLPYNQPLDVARTYLSQFGSSRFETMRTFRRHITEYVLDPENEPDDFRTHLWRYPVRHDLAVEYLGITPEDYATLFSPGGVGPATLPLHYGFAQGAEAWIDAVTHLPVFLERTCLNYCEFLELMEAGFVEFDVRHRRERALPECEPCCLDEFFLVFTDPADPTAALKLLNAFIRLWRRLNETGHIVSFTKLADIAEVLAMFNGTTANPDFIRQLAALLMLRADFGLPLSDDSAPGVGASGAGRMHLLAFWQPGANHFDWAIERLLYAIQRYAMQSYDCACRPPEFLKLLRDNLDALSRLAGFDPDDATATWHVAPTHTLRFAEVLAKIYASKFQVGELLFLFTADPQLQGGDPFPMQTANEARDLPFAQPDDEELNSLFALRDRLLAIDSGDEPEGLTWAEMGAELRRFGMPMPPDSDRWPDFGARFFPGVLSAEGVITTAVDQRYQVPLAATSSDMWNTGGGPFHYDPAAAVLWLELGFADADVLAKLARIRQLSPQERDAVSALYHQPRTDLVFFSFLFDSQLEAEARLIEEPDEATRWRWFQHCFARFLARCDAIADHLGEHLERVTGDRKSDGPETAKLVLRHLWATENLAQTPWEDDSGAAPNVTWGPQPNGGAFHALLGVVGTGMLAEYRATSGLLRWREIRGGIDAFGAAENGRNAPVPTVIPAMNATFTPEQLHYAAIRNGFALSNDDNESLGGGEPFLLTWHGQLLIEKTGKYGFAAGAPSPGSALPDFEALRRFHRWRVSLKQGQKSWVVLAQWPDEEAPGDCAAPILLERGFYDLTVEFERLPVHFDGPEDVCPQTTGFQLKYDGPDADGTWQAIPNDKLFIASKSAPLNEGFDTGVTGAGIADFLSQHYVSTLRDMRATYQMAFKAMLFVDRLSLSARPEADDGQSELAYMLSQPEAFRGQSHYAAGAIQTHRANFDVNFFPRLDNYHSPAPADDMRVAPSAQRIQALFDWWERLFDYTVMRAATQNSPEKPAWKLFHEAEESHTDRPGHLLRNLNVDIRHDDLVLHYFDPIEGDPSYEVISSDLIDERWAIRVWRADLWVRALMGDFLTGNIRAARPFLWASDGPAMAGLENLTGFYRDGCIEIAAPRRYGEIETLNNALRLRGHAALIAWLTRLDRVPLTGGGFARNARDLSDQLLMDVEVGLCQKAARIEEAIAAVQLFVNRARLGLEPGLTAPTSDFLRAWDRRFAGYRLWQSCKRREIYRENWIDWEKIEAARKSEAFAFFETELRQADLTLPVPGALVHWPGDRPPAHSGTTLLQNREPSSLTRLDPPRQGLGLLGTPDRHARPSWLAPLTNAGGRDDDGPNNPDRPSSVPPGSAPTPDDGTPARFDLADDGLPMWFRAAVRLGTEFLRITAAAIPASSTGYDPRCDLEPVTHCCADCGKTHPALMDEYYVWLEASETYSPIEQIAEWGAVPDDPVTGAFGDPLSDWHRPETLPGLLHWMPRRTVHLRWCRVHNGEFQTPRKSKEGLALTDGTVADLEFIGRAGDSLTFVVNGGLARPGYPSDLTQPFPAPGFRYDIARDTATLLPEVVTAAEPDTVGGLSAFPYFAWHCPGAPILPQDPFAMTVTAAAHLSTHCRFEDALGWLNRVWNPLEGDNRWVDCDPRDDDGDGSDDPRIPVPSSVPQPGSDTRPIGPDVITRAQRCCCPSAPIPDAIVARRHITMRYLDAVLDWADALMRRNTPEAFGQSRLLADTVHRVLGDLPVTVVADPGDTLDRTVAEVSLACPPLNPRLMCLYTRTRDRLDLIHACLNARRIANGTANDDMHWFGSDGVRECWKLDGDLCLDQAFWCRPASPYRFAVLINRAQELANELRALGGQLLSAYEKGDAEYLAQMRVLHERQINDLILRIRQDQWRDADWQVQALEKTKAMALTNLAFYRNLIAAGLLTGEAQYEPLTVTSTTLRTAGNVVEAIGQAMNLIPDPNVGFPTNFITLPPGKKLAMIFSASGTITRTAADVMNTVAGLGLSKDGWVRREDDWQHLVNIHSTEVEKIERERLGALRRRDAALRELNNQRQTMENAAEVQDYMRDKFSSHALYLWLQQETAALHHRMSELALHCAWQAQRAFNFERGHTAEHFITDTGWDDLHEGLLAGERLSLNLRQMEKAYHDRNLREYEITKTISLREDFPVAFLQLQATGICEFAIPEGMYDLDYPGHYMRRVKALSVSLPCVTGPYTNIHCRMTLLSSDTRVSPALLDPEHRCCNTDGCNNGYTPLPDDTRILHSYTATESIVTSVGTDDAGMFQLSFDDPRYLPFEYAGAICRIRLELPQENNQFDVDTLQDVVLHMRYTAREGGELLRKAARECAREILPGAGTRLIDARRETGGQWREHAGVSGPSQLLGVSLSRSMLPFLSGDRKVSINSVELLFEATGARASTHHRVTFFAGQSLQGFDPDTCKEGVHSLNCVGDAAWPGFYHGVQAFDPVILDSGAMRDVGVLYFPIDPNEIGDAYLLFNYSISNRRAE